jgi:hypothetical protein
MNDDDLDPWRDPDYYKFGRLVRCICCGITCHETHWGKWCYDCNVKRIERITEVLQSEVRRTTT